MKGGVARTSPAALSPSQLGQLRQATYRLFGALFLYPLPEEPRQRHEPDRILRSDSTRRHGLVC